MKSKYVIHAVLCEVEVIENEEDLKEVASRTNGGQLDFETHHHHQIGDEVNWDMLEEEEIKGLKDEYETYEQAIEAFRTIQKHTRA